ncbi:MAG TPA: hypothetical protein VNJ08_00830 [Bacteriovoracaceae bacterium]|nr:hypothetical protein [Bacteriovoracaceae bacterium]
MIRFFIVLTLGAVALSGTVLGKSLELTKNARSIFIEEKPDWKMGKDLFGMPFIYFSPKKNGQRSNISFTDTGANLALDMKALADNQADFKKNKDAWAKTVGATTLEFSPYEVKETKLGHKIHQIGFSYKHENKIYFERSNYIECRGKIIFSKSLRLKENEKHEKDFQELLHGLDCGGV